MDYYFISEIVGGGVVLGGSFCCLTWFIGYGIHGLLSTFKYIAKI